MILGTAECVLQLGLLQQVKRFAKLEVFRQPIITKVAGMHNNTTMRYQRAQPSSADGTKLHFYNLACL